MQPTPVRVLGFVAALTAGGCGDSAGSADRVGRATATVEEQRFESGDVQLTAAFGDGGYFRIEGSDAAHPGQDCLPGLGGGLALYGDLPSDARTFADLAGRELPFEFSGDGDDFNLCFVGSGGLLGVESGTVRFTAVDDTAAAFSFTGRFARYDGAGGQSAGQVAASGSGRARLVRD